MLTADQLASSIIWAITQPSGVDINTVTIRPVGSPGDHGSRRSPDSLVSGLIEASSFCLHRLNSYERLRVVNEARPRRRDHHHSWLDPPCPDHPPMGHRPHAPSVTPTVLRTF
jgi:hypothetical protein